MKNTFLLKFLRLHAKANSLVIINDQMCELISYNNFVSIEKYNKHLEDQRQTAEFIHINNLIFGNGNSDKYLKALQLKFKNSLSNFHDHQGFLIHKRLSIKNRFDIQINFEELTPDVKQKISSFISIQKNSLLDFINKLNPSDTQLPLSSLYWKGTIVEFIELAVVLYKAGCITSENGSITLKEFMNKLANLFHVELGAWEVMLNKAMLRKNPTKFLDKLKSTASDHYDNLLNNIK